jgi:DNA-binding NtrC family response regulator
MSGRAQGGDDSRMPPTRIHLTLHDGSAPPSRYRFEGDAVTVGRSAECDLVISDLELSRVHAQFRREGEGWALVDLGSRNGTWLNGARLVGPARIGDGDEVSLGRATLAVGVPGSAGASPGQDMPTEAMVMPAGSGPLMVGRSAAIAGVRAAIDRMAPTSKTVLITGESGTGKDVVAQLLHLRSPRAEGPFVAISCPAIAPGLLEAEMFGVEKGVATGVDARTGRFEAARGGTLFLDEIGDMELAAQAKILRVLQTRSVERIGGRASIALDVRVIAATNHDLEADVARGTFRQDLYHRLRVLTLHMAPLRERRDDIIPLAEHFLAVEAERHRLADDAVEALLAHDYPGNVRELEHLLMSAVVASDGPVIGARHLRLAARAEADGASPPASTAAGLFERVVSGGESFWDAVHAPYLRRELSREDARALVRRAYDEGGRTYRGVARLFRIEAEYQKLFDFLKNHGLKAD